MSTRTERPHRAADRGGRAAPATKARPGPRAPEAGTPAGGARAADAGTDHRRGLLREMLRIRRFEERCVELYSAGRIRGFVHLCVGEEAVSAGVFAALTAEDAVVTSYREHGHALARGLPAASVLAEM